MQRPIIQCVIIFLLCGSTTLAQDDEANPLRLVNPVAPDARHAIVESHQPVLRRESENPESPKQVEAEAEPGTAPAESSDAVSLSDVKSLTEIVEKSESLDDTQRTALRSMLENATASIQATRAARKRSREDAEATKNVPAKLSLLKERLQAPAISATPPDIATATPENLDTGAAQISAALSAARDAMKERQVRFSDLNDVRKNSQVQLEELIANREKMEEQLGESNQNEVSNLDNRIWRTDLELQLERNKAEQDALKSRVTLAKLMLDVQPLQHDLDRREIAQLEADEKLWKQALSAKQKKEARKRVAEAQRKAKEADPGLAELATENAHWATLRSDYSGLIHEIEVELQESRAELKQQEESFDSIRQRVDEIGMTQAIGKLLRSRDRKLLDTRPMRIRVYEIDKELPEVDLLLMDVSERRDAMWDLDELAETHVEKLLPRHSKASARSMVRELLTARGEYLSDLKADLHTYQQKLMELQAQLQNSAQVTAQHRSYIGEHVLWIRSADVVSIDDVTTAKQGLEELLDVRRWVQLVQDVGGHLQQHLLVWLTLLGAFTIGLVSLDRLKDRISDIGESKPVKSAFRFLPTLEAAGETIVVACFFPGVLFLLSLYLTRFPAASFLEKAVGTGLGWTSVMWLGLSLLQQVVRTGGLAEAHFGWHSRNVAVIRKNLTLLIMFGLPAVFAVMVIETFRDGEYVSSLGRLSFMGGMSVMALFTHRLLNPYRATSGVWANHEVWLFRVRHIVHAGGVIVPIALTVFAAMGFVYSAHQLAFRAQLSLWLVLGVVFVQAMLGRYLTIARRNAAVRHMQRRRVEQTENSDSEIPVEEEIDFTSIGGQVRRLLRGGTIVALVVGISLIWADMVPALKILDQQTLWHVDTVTKDGLVRTAITLADLLLALSTVFATVMAARNLPGLLNITIFERLPIDYGTRYALTAVTRYVISLTGIVFAFQCIGVTWHSVQWLVAAMTVGLGFGLQEIFANFVSGLIIFTERPVRVGDMVTVGGVTGKVTRVQIRATTITDFDRREMVVPNKRFITEDVINWTLSDPISRLVLPVGIAYNCEPELACEELLKVAATHGLVLKEPEPTAVFLGFGDSTLDLELRVFIVGRDNAFQVQNELNLAINRVFKAAELEIAYPQRDLHIRTVDSVALADVIKPRRAA